MTDQLPEAAILTLVKNKLTGERIKLWLPPYSYEDGSEAEFTLELKKRYADELHLPADVVVRAVDSLRQSSIERLTARNQFLLDSSAKLKIKVANKKNAEGSAKEHIFVETKLDAKGAFVKQQVAQQCNVEPEKLKLIANGRLIADDVSLEEQTISVTTPIMAIILQQPSTESDKKSSVRRVREDAELLAEQTAESEDYDSFMQIADQNNRPIDIPKADKKAITLAMILNEEGKSAMLKHNYSEAIPLLLEADKEFRKCRADILKLVDNYALLCMDITWCYLCLRSIEELPDAEKRLATCEDYLKMSYGENMERLLSIKGTTGCEAVLFVRLKLMKGIAAFYRRQWKIAESCFSEVERELKCLIIDDEKLSQLLAMGYSTGEARMALRSCSGDVQMAVNYLINKAKERKELKEQEEKDYQLKKLSRQLGKTANDQWVNAEFYNNLLSMGYPHSAALAALKQSNNNVPLAVQILQEHPDLLNVADPDAAHRLVNKKLVDQVMACGFLQEAAKGCLLKHNGNVQSAIEELVSTGGIFLQQMADTGGPSTSSNEASSVDKWQMQMEAFNRLKSDISKNDYDDSYLDLTLAEESQFLKEYLLLMRYAKR